MAVLLSAQQVTGASQLQIQSGNAEPGAQFAEFPDGRKPAAGDRRQRIIRRNQKIGVSTPIRSADPAAQLIELRKPESIRAIDDQAYWPAEYPDRFR